MAKNVLISGYIGFSNFGDDVIFAMLTRHLKAKGFNVRTLSANPEKTEKQFKISAYDYKNPLKIIKAISKCDYLISGGGSLLQNATSNLSLLYYILIILLARIMFKKVIIFAQGIGPIYGNFWQFLTKITLSVCNLVTVRDTQSYNLLKKWNIKSKLLDDPAWDLPTLVRENRGYVGVQLREYPKMHPDFIKIFVKYLGIYFSDRKIIVFSFQNPQDLKICYKFEKELKSQWPEMKYEIRTDNSINSIVQGFSNLEYLFAMRFHACLLGLKYGIKVFALPYDIKVEYLANEFKLQSLNVDSIAKDINSKFTDFVQNSTDENIQTYFEWHVIDKFMS